MGPSGPAEREGQDLSGRWRAAPGDEELRRRFAESSFDDGDWAEVTVPGHWRSTPAFASWDGPVLHRRVFAAPPPAAGRRSFVVLDGCFYQGDVWLDGTYLGDTEGYFLPHAFEVTDQLRRRSEHVLAVELTCAPQPGYGAKRNLTGVFQHWTCLDPDWNPGGIWRPVRLVETGPVRIASLRVRCPEATVGRATLQVTAGLDAAAPGEVELRTRVALPQATVLEHVHPARLTSGANDVTWRVDVVDPPLWWPRALDPGGDPPALVDVEVQAVVVGAAPAGGAAANVAPGRPSDAATRRTGLRQVRMRRWVLEVNGERIFLKGASLGPTRMALGEATAAELERDVRLAQEAGLDLLRVHGHVGRPELYEAADRAGLLLWQDLPLQRGHARSVRPQALPQTRAAVELLAHHPSVVLWCGHNEPEVDDRDGPSGPAGPRRFVRSHVLPAWNKAILDPALARALEVADGSRPVVRSSGVLPHPAWGTDTHASFGWSHGNERDLPRWLRRLPLLARFVTGFGAQAVPETAAWMEPERWPDLDWDRLGRTHGMQKPIFDRRVPPANFATFDAWRAATQEHQATVLRHHVEALRRLKYRPTGGFCQFLLADCHPAVSWSVLDHERVPKAGYAALQGACAPVIVTADRPAAGYRPGTPVALDVHVVSDLRQPLEGCTLHATLAWAGGAHRWGFTGEVAADAVARVGTLSFIVPDEPGPLTIELRLEGPATATATYRSEICVSRRCLGSR